MSDLGEGKHKTGIWVNKVILNFISFYLKKSIEIDSYFEAVAFFET